MAKLYVFLAATTFLMLIALGAAIAGTSAGDSITGTPHRDRLHGLGGADIIVGDKDADRLIGGAGSDHVDGLQGGGSDLLDCGPGFDTFEASSNDTVMGNCERRRG